MKFYKCNKCGNVVIKAVDSGVVPFCCGEKMEELVVNTVEASVEKHLPVVEKIDDCRLRIQVGSVEHPMLDVHFIQWVAVESKEGVQIKYLQPGQAPKAVFALSEGDELVAVYEYCNLHGLWKA